jgi:NTE family protein
MDKYAITLAGGGSKGIYEIGAWKALKELGIEYEAVTGTSIGAINGAFMVQGDLMKAYDMWHNIRMDQCIRLPENVELTSDNLLDRQYKGMLIKEVVAHGGIDQSPLLDLLAQYIDLDAVYESAVDFGLCTYSLKNRSSRKVWRSDIPRDQFFRYLLASAALPGLRSVKLDDHIYLDGGFGDNLPFDMLRRRGLRNIIAIDLRPVKNRPITTDRIRITHICNSMDLGGTLDLSPSILTRNFELGYLDTQKTFGLLDGLHYYFPSADYQYLLSDYEDGIVSGLEQAALLYDMQRDRVYTASEFLRSLYRCREKAAEQYAAERQRIDADGILSSVRSGTLHRLKNMKSCVRLALLMELMTDMKKNGSKWSIPLKLFHDMDQAANALLYLEP